MASVSGRYGGVVSISGFVYLADKDNNVLGKMEDFVDARVETDVDQVVASKFSATIAGFQEHTAYQVFLAPYLGIEYYTTEDPLGQGSYFEKVSLLEQVGLYTLLPMSRDWNKGAVTQEVQAWDMMWLLSQRYSYGAITLPAGTNVINYIRGRLDMLDFRHAIQTSGQNLSKEMTWQDGVSWVTVFNDLLDAIGFYHLWADRTGRIVSRVVRLISKVQEQATLSTEWGDIGTHVVLEPDPEWIKNDVLVQGSSPGQTPITARATNKDRNSPTSIYGLRSGDTKDPIYLTHIESDPSIETSAIALARARKILEERSSMFYRLQIETVPIPGLDMREPIRLEITDDDGREIANEKWWWDHMSIGFTAKDGIMSLRCNQLLEFEVAEEFS
jgi:hypothetical protein